MGQAWWIQPTNNTSVTFQNNGGGSGCFYDLGNLTPVNGGFNNLYVQAKNSGSCAFETSWFSEWYGTANSGSGAYFGIGLVSSNATLTSPGAPWVTSSFSYGSYTAYTWTLVGGYVVGGVGLNPGTGGTDVMSFTLSSPTANAAALSAALPKEKPKSTPARDGSDYQPPPKK